MADAQTVVNILATRVAALTVENAALEAEVGELRSALAAATATNEGQ